jgi:hypothetical protein
VDLNLEIGELYVLAHLCWVSLHDQPEFNIADCLKLERKHLIFRNLVGKWRVTPEGRRAGATGKYQWAL